MQSPLHDNHELIADLVAEDEAGRPNHGRLGYTCPIAGCAGVLNHRDGQSLVCEMRRHWVVDLDYQDGRSATRALVEQGFV